MAAKKQTFSKAPKLIRVSERKKKEVHPKRIFVFAPMSSNPDINELEAHRTLKNAYIDYGEEEINRVGNNYAVYAFTKMVRLVKRGNKVVALDIKPEKKKSKKKKR